MDDAQRVGLLLRARPPETTLAWLLGALDAAELIEVSAMPGASTSAMHRVTVRARNDSEHSVVLRRYVRAQVLNEYPDVARHEAGALELAGRAAMPTPQLLAVDATGDRADVPAVVMSLLDGRPVWETRWSSQWVSQAVDAMIALHDIDVSHRALRPISTYKQSSYQPPRWTGRPELWERAVELFHGPVPYADVGFIHRDFNPGNILWVRRELTGIVDWQAACVGPRSIDPAHCRLNLFQYNPTMADDVRRLWEQRSGLTFDPWADLASIVGSLDHLRGRRTPSEATWAIEHALTAAVHELS